MSGIDAVQILAVDSRRSKSAALARPPHTPDYMFLVGVRDRPSWPAANSERGRRPPSLVQRSAHPLIGEHRESPCCRLPASGVITPEEKDKQVHSGVAIDFGFKSVFFLFFWNTGLFSIASEISRK